MTTKRRKYVVTCGAGWYAGYDPDGYYDEPIWGDKKSRIVFGSKQQAETWIENRATLGTPRGYWRVVRLVRS
jgi:hypothetical protein